MHGDIPVMRPLRKPHLSARVNISVIRCRLGSAVGNELAGLLTRALFMESFTLNPATRQDANDNTSVTTIDGVEVAVRVTTGTPATWQRQALTDGTEIAQVLARKGCESRVQPASACVCRSRRSSSSRLIHRRRAAACGQQRATGFAVGSDGDVFAGS